MIKGQNYYYQKIITGQNLILFDIIFFILKNEKDLQ